MKQSVTSEILKGFFTKEQLQCIVGACLVENRELKKDLEKAILDIRQLKNTIASLNTRVTDLGSVIYKLRHKEDE